jgi:hypothetical protein
MPATICTLAVIGAREDGREEETDRGRTACADFVQLPAIEKNLETRRLRGKIRDGAACRTAQVIM